MKTKILVSAFEPFGNETYNPTESLLDSLTDDIIKLRLPVSYKRSADLLKTAIEENTPDFVICLGLAGGRSEICLEYCALNVKDASIADNDGVFAKGEPVIAGGENALFTSLPVGSMSEKIKAQSIPCRVSYHAGTYVCNSTYYTLLSSGTPGCFIHIPYDEVSIKDKKSVPPFIKLSESATAVSEVIKYLKELKD